MKTPGFQDLTERYSAAFSNITYGTFTSNWSDITLAT
jgi:hypothetical protein